MGNTNGTSSVDSTSAPCEAADLYGSAASILLSSIVFGAWQFVSKENKPESPYLLVWVFTVLIGNHLYLEYLADRIAALDVDVIASFAKWLPVLVGLILMLASINRQDPLAIVVTGGFVAFFVMRLDTTYTIVSVSVCVIAVILILRIPRFKLYAIAVLMYAVTIANVTILTAALLTPDDETCGHPRNKLALCYPGCPTITTEPTFYWPVPIVAAAVLGLSQLIAYCYKSDRAARQRQKLLKEQQRRDLHPSMASTGTTTELVTSRMLYGRGEEGRGQEYLHQPISNSASHRFALFHDEDDGVGL